MRHLLVNDSVYHPIKRRGDPVDKKPHRKADAVWGASRERVSESRQPA